MNASKKSGRDVGILFLFGFSGGVAAVFTKPLLNATDYLTEIGNHEAKLLVGIFLLLIMSFSCAGIGMLLYSTLVKYNIKMATSVTGFRIIEGVLEIISACLLFLLIPISHQMIQSGNIDRSYFLVLGNVLNDGRAWLNNVYLLPWCIGAILYYYIFLKTKLIPNWLSLWGLIGIIICLISTIAVFFNIVKPFSFVQIILNLPIAIQELVMAIWLIVKGFNESYIENK